MPWIVFLFALLNIPLGVVSVPYIIVQAPLIAALGILCNQVAIVSRSVVGVLAMLQCLWRLEQFQEKWTPVFRPELREIKNLVPFGVSMKRRIDLVGAGELFRRAFRAREAAFWKKQTPQPDPRFSPPRNARGNEHYGAWDQALV